MNFLQPDQNQVQGFKIDPGKGNLQLNAYFAAIVGPYRIAFGPKRMVQFKANVPAKIATLAPASQHCSYLALFLPANVVGPVTIMVGAESMQGVNSAVPAQLYPRVGAGAAVSFASVLIPGDTLYGQALVDLSAVVAEVYF